MNVLPGIILSFIIAFLGIKSADILSSEIFKMSKSPISPIMIAIIIGLIIRNSAKMSDIFFQGINFSLKVILKFGIICLGIRLGFLDILKISVVGIPLIIGCIAISIFAVVYFCKILQLSSKIGSLIAVGTSICGATAIVATAPAISANKEEVTYAIANITIFGIVAMLFYPFLAYYLFDGDEFLAGLFLGTSIHETAQVAGAGLIYSGQYNSTETMNIATITKLVRNMSMIAVIPLVSYIYVKRSNTSQNTQPPLSSIFPFFIIGFIVMGLFRSVGAYGVQETQLAFGIISENLWISVVDIIKLTAEYSLAISMAAIGLSTNLRSLKSLGIKPFYVGFCAAMSVGLISYLGIMLMKATNFIVS